ncbi:hypothetical protein TGME49_310177 [Toxoplasma gondii ME49]|uniref:Uncharacterized protein n=7 Tax=Toxoplasma gondii TaxID=5811 RepID=A0A125YPX0_TOXGV|nr:hypothetical protein TGME49_310177 [Toxoplasma gondii ME49]EPR60860.1 hypothetical protein TGGT1_310177 [Toxoplasma gondii GT1]ESS34821.1 hypothetical protein TGVEG_310177 [Toxoplasma gondii VEG]KAF4639196.1 hypothetical protein TGRH88_049680 [Toxoplasma gondii]KFH02400.1 hypothetical protein TGVAND_310177 [Toxoplasma gondii VAND]KYF47589.1 hypothetical protein TGARI_310177 [Toxoplasma gondii ARI]PIL98178.1 hypothetical protein TGCOUG_310177 [Toxoplasma gondii COUG]|eukprot:XP_018635583.1 hypothetical protein TGME49_310177 [Toxoplasma gondii ME49]
MRSRIPPTCPASPDYHHGLSSFEVAKNDNEKNFLAKPPTALIDGASPRLSAVPILNNEKRQRTLQNTRISDGVLFFRASENFPPMNVSDGKPHQTEAQDAPGHAMKVNAGSNAQPFPTTPVGIMSEKVKQSPTKSSRGCGCRRRFSVRDEKPRKQQAGTATKERKWPAILPDVFLRRTTSI